MGGGFASLRVYVPICASMCMFVNSGYLFIYLYIFSLSAIKVINEKTTYQELLRKLSISKGIIIFIQHDTPNCTYTRNITARNNCNISNVNIQLNESK